MVSGSTNAHGRPRKRKPRTDGDDVQLGRAIKHRASLACQSCRSRKVRCDVLKAGDRCTNCRLDELNCVVLPSRRGRTRKQTRQSGDSTPPSTSSAIANEIDFFQDDDAHFGSAKAVSNDSGHVPVCVTFDDELDNLPRNGQFEFGIRPGHSAAERDSGHITPVIDHRPLLQPAPPEQSLLPAFILPLASHLQNEDLDFLKLKGALILPSPELQVEILRAYLFSVHPFMPMLEYRTFVHAMLHRDGPPTISLLLFQTVMFAGLHSLPCEVIQRLGFKSTKEAREVFFNRARLLYEFDVEPQSANIAQSLILMSSWYSKVDGRRDTWHWVGLAYDVARRMGLHREPAKSDISERELHFRRRIWWSLYIRDRMITLGTRRVMRIRDDEFNVAPLTIEDFDLDPVDEVDRQAIALPVEEMRSTASKCIKLVQLSQCIGRIVSSQYTTLGPGTSRTIMITPRRQEDRSEDLESCERELIGWFQSQETDADNSDASLHQSKKASCSQIHRKVLLLTFHTTMNVLHRAQALQPQPESEHALSAHRTSQAKVKAAARSITKLLQSMLRQDEVRYLGLIGVTALIAASLTHMLDVNSADEDVRDASAFRLYQSLDVLRELRTIYASADASITFLAFVTRKTGISLPASLLDDQRDAENPGRNVGSRSRSSIQRSPVAGQKDRSMVNSEEQAAGLAQDHGIGPSAASAATSSDLQTCSVPSLNAGSSEGLDLGQLADSSIGNLINSTMEGGVGYWNDALDTEFEPYSFNYDFYSDAFGPWDRSIDNRSM